VEISELVIVHFASYIVCMWYWHLFRSSRSIRV